MNKRQSPKLFAIRAISQILCGAPVGVFVGLFFGAAWGLGAFVLAGLIASTPIDRYLDERYRQLEPLDD
jgi:hypothetical protein